MRKDEIIEKVAELTDECYAIIEKIYGENFELPKPGTAREGKQRDDLVRLLIHDKTRDVLSSIRTRVFAHQRKHKYRGAEEFKERFRAYYNRITLEGRLKSLSRDPEYAEFYKEVMAKLDKEKDLDHKLAVGNALCLEASRRFGIPCPIAPSLLEKCKNQEIWQLDLDPKGPLDVDDNKVKEKILLHSKEISTGYYGRRILLSLAIDCPDYQWREDIGEILEEQRRKFSQGVTVQVGVQDNVTGSLPLANGQTVEVINSEPVTETVKLGRRPKKPHSTERTEFRLMAIDAAFDLTVRVKNYRKQPSSVNEPENEVENVELEEEPKQTEDDFLDQVVDATIEVLSEPERGETESKRRERIKAKIHEFGH